nr:hypothetical protein [Tanacetum cinerariifolium]
MCEMVCQIVQKKQEEKRIEDEQAANARYWKIPACCDDDDDYNSTITPVLSTEEPVDSLSIPDTMCDVHLVNNPTPLKAKDHFEIVINSNDDISYNDDDSLYNENNEYVEASPHNYEFVSLEVAEIVILEDEEIEDDHLCKKLLNVHLLIANIEALKDNPLHLSKISGGSTTTHSDISLSEYEAFSFYDDHIEKISSGSTTTHSDISLSEYEAFSFYDDHIEKISSGNQFPPTDRSDFTHEEFTDELAYIISPLKYDCFYFRNLPDPGELISILNSKIRENLSSTRVNLPVEDDHSPLLAYVVWIFLAYLTYPVIPPYLHSFKNEDTIFDPGITINCFYSFKPGLSHWCGIFKKFNTHRMKDFAMWDCGHRVTWGVGGVNGTVLVRRGVRERAVGMMGVLAGNLVGIDETDCDFEEDIRLIKKLLYDNSSPRPPEEFVSANSNAKIKYFSPSPIFVKDSDSLMEEIDLFCTLDYLMPSGIMDKDYDSERDILIPKDLPCNNTLSFAEKESFHFDIPPFSRPPAKPPDGDT